MSLIGVSMLETQQMIEQAFLPDRCKVSCTDGQNLSIRLEDGLAPTIVPMTSLNSCRDLLALVGQIKSQSHAGKTGLRAGA